MIILTRIISDPLVERVTGARRRAPDRRESGTSRRRRAVHNECSSLHQVYVCELGGLHVGISLKQAAIPVVTWNVRFSLKQSSGTGCCENVDKQ